jgi:hypothetical protein
MGDLIRNCLESVLDSLHVPAFGALIPSARRAKELIVGFQKEISGGGFSANRHEPIGASEPGKVIRISL